MSEMEVIRLQTGCKGEWEAGGSGDRGAHGQEGSRFIPRQLYGLAAGGSRERFDVWQLYRLRPTRFQMNTFGRNARWVSRGSRLLSHFAAAHAIVQNDGSG
jgi:hypothetical protein